MAMLIKNVVIPEDHLFPFTSSATILSTKACPSSLSSVKLFVTPRRIECEWRRRSNNWCDHSVLICSSSSSILPSSSHSKDPFLARFTTSASIAFVKPQLAKSSSVLLDGRPLLELPPYSDPMAVSTQQESMVATTIGSRGACMVVLCSSSLRFRSFPPHSAYSFPRIVFQPIFCPGVSCASKAMKYAQMRKSKFKVLATGKEISGSLTDIPKFRFAVVAGRFNELVTKALVAGALETFKKHSIKDDNIDVVWVPGSFEIPVVAQALAKTGKYNAVLCIGAVIRGDTTHYEGVANSATSGVLSAGLNTGIPCILGVLTCDTLEQALQRAGGKSGNKGAEAAITAIDMASLFQHDIFKKRENHDS